MLTTLVQGFTPNGRNVWCCWLNHITKDGDKMGVKEAALVTKLGSVLSHTPCFKLSVQEIQNLNDLFHKRNKEKVSIQGRTYVISSLNDKHLVAFSGTKFLVVCPSETMYIVVRTECHQGRPIVTWLEHLCSKLSSCKY